MFGVFFFVKHETSPPPPPRAFSKPRFRQFQMECVPTHSIDANSKLFCKFLHWIIVWSIHLCIFFFEFTPPNPAIVQLAEANVFCFLFSSSSLASRIPMCSKISRSSSNTLIFFFFFLCQIQITFVNRTVRVCFSNYASCYAWLCATFHTGNSIHSRKWYECMIYIG